MVANVTSTATTPKPKVSSRGSSPARAKRAPLLPSEADNNGPSMPPRPKSRDVSSRYLSSTASSASIATTMTSTSSSSSFCSTTTSSSSNSMCTPRRRFPSPLISSTNLMTPASTVNDKRAQTAERRHPGTPRISEMSTTAKMLTSMPARSLSVSFQGQSFALPVSKASKPPPTASNNGSRPGSPDRRASTPVRKPVNPKPIDQQRWPARSRQGSFLTKSVDFTNENMKLSGSGTATAVRALQKSMISETKSKPPKLEIPEHSRSFDKLLSDCDSSDRAVSDGDSVSSGSTPGKIRGATPRAIVVPARLRQETVNRLRRLQPEPVSPPLSRNNKVISGSRYLKDGPTPSPRGLSPSPVRGAVRPASPNRIAQLSSTSSPSRGMASPTRTRNAVGSNSNLGNTNSILSFAAETRRRKVGDNAIADAHELRLLHNKYLQWRFENARADAAMLVQRAIAEKSLYNSWVTTSKMRQSVISKQMEIQHLSQSLKLHSVLKNQIPYLKVWDKCERDYSLSLSGTIDSLESTTLRLPLLDGAKADSKSLQDAIRSAIGVMHTISTSISSVAMKVDSVNALASELSSTTANERSKMNECKDMLSLLTQMEVEDCSLRTHILQMQRVPTKTITEV